MLLGETRDYRLTKLGSKLTFTAMSLPRFKNRNRTALRCYLKDDDLLMAETVKSLTGCSMSQLLYLGLLSVVPLVSEMGKVRDLEATKEYLTNYEELKQLVKTASGFLLLHSEGWLDGHD